MNQYDAALANLEEEEQNLLPTPRVGEVVIWYPKGHVAESNAVAAIVTKREAPGRISLTGFPAASRQMFKVGVIWARSPKAQDPSNRATSLSGSWDYRDGDGPAKRTDRDFQMHQESIDSRREALKKHREAKIHRPAGKDQEQAPRPAPKPAKSAAK